VKPPTFLTRITGSGTIIPEIEGLRFIAIIGVVLFHLRGYVESKSPLRFSVPLTDDWLARVLTYGDSGVPLFFVISGFVLALPFANHRLNGGAPIDVKRYVQRRLTRLEPPYIITLVIFLFALILTKGEGISRLVLSFLASLFYVHAFAFHAPSVINAVCWSLEVEIQFYLLMPLFAYIYAIRGVVARRGLLLFLALVLPTVVAIVSPGVFQSPGVRLSLLAHYPYFAMGMLLADCYVRGERLRQPSLSGDLLALLGMSLLVALRWFGDGQSSTSVKMLTAAPIPLVIFGSYYGALSSVYVRKVLASPWICAIGGMCYTIYLVHYPVISFVGRMTIRFGISDSFALNYAVQMVLVLPVVFAFSAAFFALIERPCMERDWPQRLKTNFLRIVSARAEMGAD
jgi:peptidoglycan/LPS O-acetylase OafA/YrhL